MSNRAASLIPALACILLAAGSSGCMRHVYFPENVRTGPAPDARSPVRLLYDRQGNLYPDASVYVRGEQSVRRTGRGGNWTLRQHFENAPNSWGSLAARYLRAPTQFTESAWRAVQDSIRSEGIRAITGGSRPGTPIVVLIHGFNTSEPVPGERDAFDDTRDSLTSWYGAQTPEMTFVEVRWDGLVATGPLGVRQVGSAKIWPFAQANGLFVGMELRRVLAALPHDRPVRILTHSLGAHVATAALWNVSSKLSGGILDQTVSNASAPYRELDPWARYFNGFAAPEYRTPTHPDLRLAMIVPAIPGLTFGGGVNTDFYDRNFAGRPAVTANYRMPQNAPASTYNRIIVGQNEKDRIIEKFIGAPTVYGSTTLGSRPAEFDTNVARYLNGFPERNSGNATVAFAFNVREAPAGLNEKEHAWELYLHRRQIRALTDCLFTERCSTSKLTIP